MKTICVHTLVQNEEKYIWYAIKSVIDFVDKVMVWDTGSTDRTTEIVKELTKKYPKKIFLKICDDVSPSEYPNLRQKMLEATKYDWIMILDGDEVWWKDSIEKNVEIIQKHGDKLESTVNPYINLVGDIYNKIPDSKGLYKIDNQIGHLSIRFINRAISGLHASKPHGQQGFFDGENTLIQDRDPKRRRFVNTPYLHFTHLLRSSYRDLDRRVPKRSQKYKYEIGEPLPLDFFYPEVFFIKRPDDIPSPWRKRSVMYKAISGTISPLKMIKRNLLPTQKGY